MMNKKILDACCGGRCFYFDKKNKDTLYIDIEERPKGTCPQRPNWNCTPDMIADFRNLPFNDESFYHVVFLSATGRCVLQARYRALPLFFSKCPA